MTFRHQNDKPDTLMMLAVSVVMFFLTLSALASIGFVPSYIDGEYPAERNSAIEVLPDADGQLALSSLPQLGEADDTELLARAAQNPETVNPSRVVIHSIGVDVSILNPESADIEVLDEALLEGVVRYPLSGALNEDGNMFIFGHSSQVAIVKNPMYKVFNRLGELRDGDTIKVIGNDGTAHIYRVSDVRRADASEALIDLSPTGKYGRKLTLSTCDSFGGKSSRFVIEADFIGSYKE